MWKLHRYYLKELAINGTITFLVLFGVVLVSTIYRGIKMADNGGGNLLHAVMFILLWAADTFPHLLTISFLIASVLTFTRAAQDRELTAIRAAGIAPTTPLLAAILIGILQSVLGSLLLHYVIPEAHYRKYRVLATVAKAALRNVGANSDRIRPEGTGAVLTFRQRADHGERFDFLDCTLYLQQPLFEHGSPIVFVDRVSALAKEGDDVVSIELSGIRDPISAMSPSTFHLGVSQEELANIRRRDDRDDDMRSDQLLSEVLRGVHPKPFEAIYTLFRRCCFSLMPTLLAPIGFCIAELARERGRVFALVLALLPLGLFYLGEVLGARFLLSTQNPLFGWLPAVFLLVLGVPLCWRQLRR
ncbi:MAG: LptF/LptG family permease [Planctomycetes bacterium]|nr:LptF/LptG family permease [Planctomycetota bacterium]